MSHATCTFVYIWNKLRCQLLRQNTTMRQAITVEERVAVTLWKLAAVHADKSQFNTTKANLLNVLMMSITIVFNEYHKIATSRVNAIAGPLCNSRHTLGAAQQSHASCKCSLKQREKFNRVNILANDDDLTLLELHTY